jgi:hypothetical protein
MIPSRPKRPASLWDVNSVVNALRELDVARKLQMLLECTFS